ncbi:MAG: hypothetical protein MJ248_00995 [Bacilli bacterium]|nr:hypothetical protein [Bacilli bacterium]
MEEFNQSPELSEARELTPEEKKQRSTNRFFGLFLILDIALAILLIVSIISIIVGNK